VAYPSPSLQAVCRRRLSATSPTAALTKSLILRSGTWSSQRTWRRASRRPTFTSRRLVGLGLIRAFAARSKTASQVRSLYLDCTSWAVAVCLPRVALRTHSPTLLGLMGPPALCPVGLSPAPSHSMHLPYTPGLMAAHAAGCHVVDVTAMDEYPMVDGLRRAKARAAAERSWA